MGGDFLGVGAGSLEVGFWGFPLGALVFLNFRLAIIHGPKTGVSFSGSETVGAVVVGVEYAGPLDVAPAELGFAAFTAAVENRQDSVVCPNSPQQKHILWSPSYTHRTMDGCGFPCCLTVI